MTFVSKTNIYVNVHIVFTLGYSDISWICAGKLKQLVRGMGLILVVVGLFEKVGGCSDLANARA